MTLSFRGEFSQKVDAKGRVSVPADFRRVLEAGDPSHAATGTARLVLLYGPHLKSSLHVYTIDAMSEIEEGIRNLPRGSEARKKASRNILSKSWETEVDKDGRIVLPLARRQQLGLGDAAEMLTMAAMGDYFEIWRQSDYDAQDEGDDGVDPLIYLDAAAD